MDDSECKIVLRIYPGFSEVRRDIDVDNQFQLTLSEEQYEQIIPNSIEIESDHTTLQTITKKSTNLEGKTVYVRNSGGKDTPPKKATLVRGSDWLVKDHQSGRFYRAAWSDMEFEQPPATDVYDVEFNFSQPVKATLSFLISTISWKPKYQLMINDEGESTVKCVAIIRNDSPMKYFVQKAELFGGQVVLPQTVRHTRFAASCRLESSIQISSNMGALSDFTAKDISGVHQYDLLKSFCLNADSSVYIEFLRPTVSVEQFSSIEVSNPGDFSQAMDRVYMLCSDQFLPAGNLSIRQSGRIVGFHELSDLPAKEKREISLGKDSSSVVERKETVIKKSDSSSKMKVHLSLINNHGKTWRLRYRENSYYHDDSDTAYVLEGCEGARQTNDGCEIIREVPAGQRSEAEFVLIKKIHKKIHKPILSG